ncbi:MAG: hypothetical protein OXE99_10100 [Cellvibrionales bacterium]|nr:hypothetical protein [Cellvibrionales bacterium]
MQRTLYLHVGPQKTGTTAIQVFFRENKQHQIYYPVTGRWLDGAHHKLVFSQIGRQRYGDVIIPEWKVLYNKLDNELEKTDKDILISSEHAEPEFLRALRPIIVKHNFQVKIIVTFRHPLERAASSYNQNVKDPVVGLNQLPDEFLAANQAEFKASSLYSKWRNLNPNILALAYKDKEPLVKRFCHLLNIQIGPQAIDEFYNQSMGGTAVAALVAANKIFLTEEERKDFFDHLQTDTSIKMWKGNSFPFSKKACEVFLNHYQEDILWAKIVLGIDLTYGVKTTNQQFSLSEDDQAKITALFEKVAQFDAHKKLIKSVIDKFNFQGV